MRSDPIQRDTIHVPKSSHSLAERWSLAERLVGLGWGEWNLVTDEIVWTPRLYEVYDRDPADGPLRLDHLPEVVLPDDLPAVQERLRTLFEQRRPVDGEYRIRGRHGTRHLRVLHEPLLDASGRIVAIRTLAMDVSAQREAAEALDETREEVLQARRRVEDERRIARRLRRALLPVREGLIEFPGLRVAVRYLAGEPGRVGGDWWKARRLPDDRVLLAIGDAMGHGLEATAMMTEMRAGLAGLAYTGAAAPQLATWLNELVCHMVPGETVTGTAALGHFDPVSRELAWTSAGHPPPVLVRDRHARLLDDLPHGPMLGVLEEAEFPLTVTALEPGDIVLFYTDGILDRQGRDREDLTEAMLDAVQSVAQRVARSPSPENAGDAADPTLAVERVMLALDAEESADDICVMAIQVR
ncbi:PP2C family protein-serine/threonine phosphatase [Actinomadura rudentiformis]|uniref:SpoIIE family protein phosphatase n=1 Tax=Actinomadura rudentiformis TaxID=359158 RepID=A0A6H9YWW5_9ACTN|nr:PP2C family protein-serine/threonine phosphatase [Actinomadura rudentiformis]KAB2345521.1 SpoIIE family protein phosphatase [Actinomadura rudentiformis]